MAISGSSRVAGRSSSRGSEPLRPVDRIELVFLAGLALVTVVGTPRPLPLLAVMLALAAGILGASRWGVRSPVGGIVHDFFPIVVVAASFEIVGPVLSVVNPARWDATLAALDLRLFPRLVSSWRGALGRPSWLTDAASLVYTTYYPLPVLLAAALYTRGRRRDFEVFVFGVVVTFLASFAAYFWLPAYGPRVPAELAAHVLGGGRISAGVRAFLGVAEVNRLDAFPSAHAALPVVELALAWRLLPRWRAPVAALVAAIIFSTVYLSLHYVIDIVAGVAFGALMWLSLDPLRRSFRLVAAPRR